LNYNEKNNSALTRIGVDPLVQLNIALEDSENNSKHAEFDSPVGSEILMSWTSLRRRKNIRSTNTQH